jgi:hypothetical protein
MSSPSFPRSPTNFGRSPYRRGSFLLSNEEPDNLGPLTAKGHGTLAMLIKNRSAVSLHGGHGVAGRDEEEGLVDWTLRHIRDAQEDDASEHRSLAEERRMSAILNGPHIRSIRLIGNSNPRYRWERYWKTEEQLKQMKPKM